MSLVAFGSAKGSPGATMSALATAVAWPTLAGRRTVLVEADPDGGVLAIRYGLSREPGLTSMAAAARHGLARGELWEHAQALGDDLAVVVAPDSPGEAAAAVTASGSTFGPWLAGLPDVDAVVDVGRLSERSPSWEVAHAADVLVMVSRPRAEETQAGAERLTRIRADGVAAGWCLIGERPYSAAAIEDAYGIPVFGVLSNDPRGVAALEQVPSVTGRRNAATRSNLFRSAAALSAHLAAWLHPPPPALHEPQAQVPQSGGPSIPAEGVWS